MTGASHDPYWSRRGTQWSFGERCDPVLWAPDARGPLSHTQLESFDKRGFLVLEDAFDADEVAELLDGAHALAEAPDAASREDVITEPDSDAVRSVFDVHRDAGRFARLVADTRLAGAARQILGSEVYVHQSRVNFKPGFVGREFFWHSDFETWHIEDGMPRMRALSASLLLTGNTPGNGPLMLVPGSHRRYVRTIGETPPEHYKASLRRQTIGVPAHDALEALVDDGGLELATGPAGTLVLFDCNTMHASTGNLSPWPRHNVFVVFNSVHNRLVEPFGGTPARPDFLAARDTTDTLP